MGVASISWCSKFQADTIFNTNLVLKNSVFHSDLSKMVKNTSGFFLFCISVLESAEKALIVHRPALGL